MSKKEFLKKIGSAAGAVACLGAVSFLTSCSEDAVQKNFVVPDSESFFENCESVTIDAESDKIEVPADADSLVIGSLSSLGGSYFYIALDDDPVDPTFDWDNPLDSGAVVSLKDVDEVRIVVLDENHRVVKIWTVAKAESRSSSSKENRSSSSSEPEEESSSSVERFSSSAEESSSSNTDVESCSSSVSEKSSSSAIAESSSSEVSSSSKALESSSSVEVSSSSVESSSSSKESSSSSAAVSSSSVEEIVSSSSVAKKGIDVNSLTVDGGTVSINGSKIYVELPYGSDLAGVKFDQLDTANNLIRPIEMEFESEGSLKTFSVVAGVQLPGSDFSKRVDSFWGTTSDAMATDGSGTYKVLIGYTVKISSEANATFEDSRLTLTTRTLTGSSLGISGGWKMAGGFYYAGSFSGTDAASIYVADNEDAGADSRPADFSQYMTHGRPFVARPVSFDVKYAYEHVDCTNDTYPQSSLIYVVLVSADKKIVAAGSLTDNVSVNMTTKTVELQYGSDAGLIAAGYAGTADLKKGTGDEAVASIRVMFASSALAFVADGGTSSQMNKYFRGGENSRLVLDEFKLNY